MSYALTIGFITYGKSTAKYLPYFLSSLKGQTFKDFNILVFDNTEEAENENALYIRNNYPEIEIARGNGNLGFAAAFNRLINKAKGGGAEYFLALNPDMVLEPDAVEKMVKVLEGDSGLGSVCPKILKWNFENNKKTSIIDSCGIKVKSGLRFFDLGQNKFDKGQFNNAEILGPSGAAAMYRISVLEKVMINPPHLPLAKGGDQYFDELMFMYKEDCDLAYRLFLAGYRSKCVADAVIYHDRTTYGKGEGDLQVAFNRKGKSRQVKKWAFLHQQIIFIKYWKLQSFWNKLAIIWYEIKMIIFILLFEQYLLGELLNLWKIKKEIIIRQK
ncbi:glycosyltransferase family 2 protein [Patescibacteria group bacterium]|nr:glycosyltransferase family 2 protein [Patescibacteria group bacterium]MBU4454904.1 glycosyltransferase family 2 protein [Patescibacteria group bacterium]